MPILCPILPHTSPQWTQTDQKRLGLGDRVGKRREKKGKEEEMMQRQAEEKTVLGSNYYPPEPIYIPNHKSQPPTVVNDLILAPENFRELNRTRDTKTEDDRRVIMQLLDEERDLDYFSDSESESDYEYQSYV